LALALALASMTMSKSLIVYGAWQYRHWPYRFGACVWQPWQLCAGSREGINADSPTAVIGVSYPILAIRGLAILAASIANPFLESVPTDAPKLSRVSIPSQRYRLSLAS
jgi:hypothetical protein